MENLNSEDIKVMIKEFCEAICHIEDYLKKQNKPMVSHDQLEEILEKAIMESRKNELETE